MTQRKNDRPGEDGQQDDKPSGIVVHRLVSDQDEESRHAPENGKVLRWVKNIIKGKAEPSLREALEDYIEDIDGARNTSIAAHERVLISNILALRNKTATDVMIPRVDIAAISINSTREELFSVLTQHQFSRLPVYRETLDDVVGMIHIKDVLATIAAGKDIVIREIVRDVPIVSPAMPLLDLLLQMRQSRRHMALIVDEYGGIDGLVTIGDLVEAIVGEVEDEFDSESEPEMDMKPDGSVVADARVDIEEFEQCFGKMLTEDERENADTLGGLVFYIAGRVPARGEILTHESGLVFEILDASPRRVNRLRIRNLPKPVEPL